jgi:valyl-tRNA synthetase
MSKSLGTGIDPIDEIDVHGADALRFGLLAMSSTQDFRFSSDRVRQGRDLANKMWNASRLVLLNAVEVTPAPGGDRVEDRWIVSRLQRAIESVAANVEGYDFAHAALALYDFFWSELCDWYLEIVKPRLYDGDEAASATLLWAFDRVLALAHPMMPFVTEEIYAYLRDAIDGERAEMLVVHPFPTVDEALIDEEAEREIGESIGLTRSIRRWRDLVGVAAGSVLPARIAARDEDGEDPHELVARLARLRFDGADGGEALAALGPVEILASAEVDAEQVRSRIDQRRGELRSEVERAEGRLANEGFVANAPSEVVEAERVKLAAYREELEELG